DDEFVPAGAARTIGFHPRFPGARPSPAALRRTFLAKSPRSLPAETMPCRSLKPVGRAIVRAHVQWLGPGDSSSLKPLQAEHHPAREHRFRALRLRDEIVPLGKAAQHSWLVPQLPSSFLL